MDRETLFLQLEEVLHRQHELAGKMLDATRRQNEALRCNDMEMLNRAITELDGFSGSMRQLEESREALQNRLSEILGGVPGMPLKEIAAGAPESQSARLYALRRDLRLRLEELRQLTDTNNLLTRNALRINTTILNIFHRTGGATYGNSGQVQNSDRSLNTLNKSV